MGHTLENTKKPTVIFLADDDEDDIFFFKQAITDIGISCQVHVSKNGDELIQSLNAFYPARPSMVFLDMNMPLKNGLESLQQIRKSFADQLPVFLLSTSTSTSAIDTARRLGATGYLTKQTSFPKLKSMLGEVLSKSWMGRLKQDFYIHLEYPCPI